MFVFITYMPVNIPFLFILGRVIITRKGYIIVPGNYAELTPGIVCLSTI